MQWSKLKKSADNLLSESVKSRLEFHNTSYNRTHDNTGRCWITVDKHEVFNACTVTWQSSYHKLADEIQRANQCLDYTDPQQRKGYYDATQMPRRSSVNEESILNTSLKTLWNSGQVYR